VVSCQAISTESLSTMTMGLRRHFLAEYIPFPKSRKVAPVPGEAFRTLAQHEVRVWVAPKPERLPHVYLRHEEMLAVETSAICTNNR
jgi:hypothetical protein